MKRRMKTPSRLSPNSDDVECEEVGRKSGRYVIPDARASGCFQAPKKNPHEMGSEKGNVKIRRKIGCPQIEKVAPQAGLEPATLRLTD